jgi:Putative MetA-pathway of phenol degradation
LTSHPEIEHRLHAGDARAAMLEEKIIPVNIRGDRSNGVTDLFAKYAISRFITGAVLVVLILVGAGMAEWALAAEVEGPPHPPPQWRVSATVNYSSGSYGTDSRTNILYAPMTVRRIFRDGDVSVTIPFVSISGTGTARLVGGVPTRTGSAPASPMAALAAGSGRGKRPGDSPLSSSTTDSGLGDIILRGRFYLIEEGTIMPLVAITGRVKLPTADADRGLGTGEFDEGAGVELTKRLTDRWLTYLSGGYNIIGDAPGTDFNNQWWYDVGIGHDVTDKLHMSIFYEEYRALVNTVNNARDLLALANYAVDDTVHLTSSLIVGLSNGAPDYGFGGGVRFRF